MYPAASSLRPDMGRSGVRGQSAVYWSERAVMCVWHGGVRGASRASLCRFGQLAINDEVTPEPGARSGDRAGHRRRRSLGGRPRRRFRSVHAGGPAAGCQLLVGQQLRGSVETRDAQPFGSLANVPLSPIVGITPTHDDGGYWLVASDGGIFAYGDAASTAPPGPPPEPAHRRDGPHPRRRGLLDGGLRRRDLLLRRRRLLRLDGNIHLNQPIVGMATDPHGPRLLARGLRRRDLLLRGCRLLRLDRGVHLNKPIVAMTPTPDGKGYWLVAADGGIFTFGDAAFYGSGSAPLTEPTERSSPPNRARLLDLRPERHGLPLR